MLRTLVVALTLVLGLHHTSLVTAAPVHAGHAGAPAECADCGAHGHDGMAGMVMAACLAIAGAALRVPSVRRRVVSVLRGLAARAVAGPALRIAAAPRVRPLAPPPARPAVLRC